MVTTAPDRAGLRVHPGVLIAGAAIVALGGMSVALHYKKKQQQQHGSNDADHPVSIPYVNYVPIRAEQRGKSGTTLYKTERSFRGYNLYVQKPDAAAILTDMQGEIVHRWATEAAQAPKPLERWRGWRTVRMKPNGDLFAIVDHDALIKIDWSSKLIWKADVAAHHEIMLADDGDIYVIAAEQRLVDVDGKKRLVDDALVVDVSPDGEVKKRYSMNDVLSTDPELKRTVERAIRRRYHRIDEEGLEHVLARSKSRDKLAALMTTGKVEGTTQYERFVLARAVPGVPVDVFHANAIALLKDHPSGIWKQGDIMVSFRHLNLIIVFDPSDLHVKWSFGPGVFYGQHMPSILPNGHVLLYDNGTGRPAADGARRDGKRRGPKYTRIVELDPVTKSIVWTYEADPPTSFYSEAEGSVQRLPNENLLIGEEGGRAFEITRAKEVVWEYYNPKFDKTGNARSGMYRIERILPEVVEPLLAGKTGAAP
ncbi:MAG TPA: arylsulfotransferase family protein [Minicystis sp.]|nr:arylsulfotransferase family protein [Minicystis sp.]